MFFLSDCCFRTVLDGSVCLQLGMFILIGGSNFVSSRWLMLGGSDCDILFLVSLLRIGLVVEVLKLFSVGVCFEVITIVILTFMVN